MCLRYFTDDNKGAYLLAQLSVFPALALLSWSGLIEFAPVDSWLSWLLFPISLAIVYFIGWAISAIIDFKDPSAPVVDDPPDWHKP
jgi:hypothetical protein